MSRMPKTHRLAHRRFEHTQIAAGLAAREQVWEEWKQDNAGDKHLGEMEEIHRRFQRRDIEILEGLNKTIEGLET